MKNKTTNLASFIFILLLSQQFMSCQKDQAINSNAVNASSTDNSVHSLPVDSSLVAWYPFTNGNLRDKSGHSNGIKFNSATATEGRLGQPNRAYYFNGSSSYMFVKNSESLNPVNSITLAALVKPMGFNQSLCHGNRILQKGYSDVVNGRYLMGFDDQLFWNYNGCGKPVRENRENFICNYGDVNQNASITDTDNIKLNRWYNVVYTSDHSGTKLYINGVLKESNTNVASFTSTNAPLYIGKTESSSYPYYFNGVIDEIRIYNRALSSDEVLGLNNLMGND